MKWQDSAIIIKTRSIGEKSLIVTVLAKEHGLYAGVLRNAAQKGIKAIYQPGNIVAANWNARLSEHIGYITAEMEKPVAALAMDNSLKLGAIVSACQLIAENLSEREPHPEIYETMLDFLFSLCEDRPEWREKYVILELELLKRLGFGPDLQYCAATGKEENLAYISPKSGRAVSKEAGEKYKDRLFSLPEFLTGSGAAAKHKDVLNGLLITGYFFGKYIFSENNRKIPEARIRFLEMLSAEFVSGEEKYEKV